MKEIPLGKGRFALVDDEDYALVCVLSWHANEVRPGFTYAYHSIRHGKIVERVSMHGFILKIKSTRSRCIHHRNGNGLDNQRHNLRVIEPLTPNAPDHSSTINKIRLPLEE